MASNITFEDLGKEVNGLEEEPLNLVCRYATEVGELFPEFIRMISDHSKVVEGHSSGNLTTILINAYAHTVNVFKSTADQAATDAFELADIIKATGDKDNNESTIKQAAMIRSKFEEISLPDYEDPSVSTDVYAKPLTREELPAIVSTLYTDFNHIIEKCDVLSATVNSIKGTGSIAANAVVTSYNAMCNNLEDLRGFFVKCKDNVDEFLNFGKKFSANVAEGVSESTAKSSAAITETTESVAKDSQSMLSEMM